MKWLSRLSPKYEVGSIRIVKRFLFFPKRLKTYNGIFQWRWLEFVKIEQKYSGIRQYDIGCEWITYRWKDEWWANE